MKRRAAFIVGLTTVLSFAVAAGATTTLYGPYHGDDTWAMGVHTCRTTDWADLHHPWTDWSGFPWEAHPGECFNADGTARAFVPKYVGAPSGYFPAGWATHPVLEHVTVIPWGAGEAYKLQARVKAWPCANLHCRATVVEIQAIFPYRGNFVYKYYVQT